MKRESSDKKKMPYSTDYDTKSSIKSRTIRDTSQIKRTSPEEAKTAHTYTTLFEVNTYFLIHRYTKQQAMKVIICT